MSLRTKSLLFLSLTTLLWSSSGVIIKSVEWNPIAIASSRSLVAAVTIALLARKRGVFSLPNKAQWVCAAMLALVSFAFVSATKLTTAANAILLQYTAPVWVAIAAPLILKERTSGRDWLFIFLTFGSMALFFMDSISAEGFLGMILAILAGVFFAGMAIAVRYDKEGGPPFKSMICGNLMVFLAGLYFWQPPWPTLEMVGMLLIAGVFQYGISFYLYTLASQGVSSLELVLITSMEAILNPVWVFLFTGERPGNWSLVGGSMVLITVTLWSVLKSIKPSPALNMKK